MTRRGSRIREQQGAGPAREKTVLISFGTWFRLTPIRAVNPCKGGNTMKKVAVIVSDDQHGGLRMGVGLTLADNEVTVFLMDKPLESADDIDLNVETLGDLDAKLYSNIPGSKGEIMTTEAIARALTDFDAVIQY